MDDGSEVAVMVQMSCVAVKQCARARWQLKSWLRVMGLRGVGRGWFVVRWESAA